MSQENEYCKEIGKRIREARLSNNMTQADVANIIDVSLPHMNRIELGKANMQIETFCKITLALGVSANQLIGFSDLPATYMLEIRKLLDGCTPLEIEALVQLMRDAKEILVMGRADR